LRSTKREYRKRTGQDVHDLLDDWRGESGSKTGPAWLGDGKSSFVSGRSLKGGRE